MTTHPAAAPAMAALLALAALGCGAAPPPCPPIDGQRLAERVEARLFARLHRQQARRAQLAHQVPDLSPTEGALPPPDTQRLRVSADGAPWRGAAMPVVTIVQFSDFQCPFCARVNPTIERLLADYPNEVRWVFRHNPLPFHQQAMPAAEAAMEAYAQRGNDGFWRLHELMFQNQRALGRADLERYASAAGLDVAAVRLALDNHTHQAAIQADQNETQRLAARGTPAHFINGRQLMGAQPFEAFDEIVRQEIGLAAQLMSSGTPRAELYARLMADAMDAPPAPPPSPNAPAAAGALPPETVYHVPIAGSPIEGSRNALVTIVEFGDFECPFCARARPTLEALQQRYGNDVRFVFKHNPLPFHPNAMLAAEAAMEARAQRRDAGFFEMHDRLFDDSRNLGRQTVERHAEQMGLHMTRFRRALDEHTHRAAIQRDMDLAQALGARGTPSFFVNGRLLTGAQPEATFVALIDEELDKARRLARRVPRARVYERTIRDGVRDAAAASAAAVGGGGGPPPATPTHRVSVPTDAPRRGGANAQVVIQIFSDFQCPFCSRVVPTLDQLSREYGAQIQFVWRNYPLPFHQHAFLAAEAAVEIHAQGGDQAFWAFHDALFANQRALERDDLLRYAGQIGHVDVGRLERALDARTHRARVQADMDAVQTAGMRIGTPSFLIDDQLLQGAQPVEAFRRLIDARLGRRP